MSRACLFTAALLLAGCAGLVPPPRATFPSAPEWKTLLPDAIVPPLVAGGHRVFVATRDGAVRALDEQTGAVVWKAEDLPGVLSSADGTLLVRSAEGRLTSVHPRTGEVRWRVETGVLGPLPAVVDEDRALVPGKGLAGVELSSGRTLFSDGTGEITAPPVPLAAAQLVLTGEADGTLRSRDRGTGIPIWSMQVEGALRAPPLVDAPRGVFYLGTTSKRILEAKLDRGGVGWSWSVGADIVHPGLLVRDAVLFASFDAVLYALGRNGNLDWRAPLPSRPLSGPLPSGRYLLIACLEDEIVAVSPKDGRKAGVLKTTAEIRTPPLIVGERLVLGLRDRSVVAYSLAEPVRPPAAPTAPTAPSGPVGPPPAARLD